VLLGQVSLMKADRIPPAEAIRCKHERNSLFFGACSLRRWLKFVPITPVLNKAAENDKHSTIL